MTVRFRGPGGTRRHDRRRRPPTTTGCCSDASAPQRTVVVQPRVHGTDNSVTLAAIRCARRCAHARRGRGAARCDGRRTRASACRRHPRHPFHALHARPMRRRISPWSSRWRTAYTHWAGMCSCTGARPSMVEHAALLERLPGTVVLDHLAACRNRPVERASRLRPREPAARRAAAPGSSCPVPTSIRRSAPRLMPTPRPSRRRGCDGRPSAWSGAATGRTRPNATRCPTTRSCSTCWATGCPTTRTRHRVLVDNPARLYDFP